MTESAIVVFTDGSSKGNPGPGGWGAVIITPDGHIVERGGGASLTTNNKMELTGAIEALTSIESIGGPVIVYTDSTYVIKGIQDWLPNWRRRGWKTSTGGEVLNQNLWEQLSAVASARGPRSIEWRYVRGHVGTPGNERCDGSQTRSRQGARSSCTTARSPRTRLPSTNYHPRRERSRRAGPLRRGERPRGLRTRISASSMASRCATTRGPNASGA